MKLNVLLLSLVTLLISATTVLADWEYPMDGVVYNGKAYSFHHLKKSYEHTTRIIKDAITPEDYAMIAFELIQETDGLLGTMESIACDRCSMFYDRVISIRHKTILDLITLYTMNLSYDDVGKKHRLFDLTELIISAFLKSPCLQSYYPSLSRFVRNTDIQIAYCRGMKAHRLDGQNLGIFIGTLLDMTENPKPMQNEWSKENTSMEHEKVDYNCCGRKISSDHKAEVVTEKDKKTEKHKPAAIPTIKPTTIEPAPIDL